MHQQLDSFILPVRFFDLKSLSYVPFWNEQKFYVPRIQRKSGARQSQSNFTLVKHRLPDWPIHRQFRKIWPYFNCADHEKKHLAIFSNCHSKVKFSLNILSLKSTSVSVCFRGISWLPFAFIFLRWFKLAHISIQVCTFHDGCKQGIDQQIFNRKSISRKLTHPQSWKLQAKLTATGEKLKGWSISREKTNSRLQSKFRNTSS